jgi:hypothetical protein
MGGEVDKSTIYIFKGKDNCLDIKKCKEIFWGMRELPEDSC